jgi:hypothetical protein
LNTIPAKTGGTMAFKYDARDRRGGQCEGAVEIKAEDMNCHRQEDQAQPITSGGADRVDRTSSSVAGVRN